jgi:polysaccharide biosynthesis protein PslH
MRPYLERATCFAAPLRFAAGIQNKVLEAMAMEMHIVASPAAAGGVRTEQGREAPIEVAANASSFAQALIRQLHAGRTSPAINPQTREYVRQHFGWQQGAAKLEQVLTQAAGRRLRVPVSKEPREPLIHTASG